MTQYVEVRHPGVRTKANEEIKLGDVVAVNTLLMSARTVPHRITQGWFVERTKEDFDAVRLAKMKLPAPAGAPAPQTIPLGPGGAPSPDQVGEMVAAMESEPAVVPETAPESIPEAPEGGENTPEGVDDVPPAEAEPEPEGEEPEEPALHDLADEPAPEEDSLLETEPNADEPLRNGMTINEYWDHAEKVDSAPRSRVCPHCGEKRAPKSVLFECCSDQSDWTGIEEE